ncbi:MarR family winged helix-turn-helix transcriptional regulator [Schleiferilactobacillus harbinensis]|jgi:DNA-binding MarR family transcriptional regulator|uniref:MarR family winged helix-turn-helix transcriptional regulator n=1 Tax=Schleiferilactobacillus harbinensis TaxID=304207 RepID=UPI00242B8030|nr:MarR family winged helix-turn-helix transcriptional regulator [Schleiferilactobacillus harbinensis]MCI1686531.1 MarR family winged helix-turn-helix transcriptional regulator [Schleiferilactobacillus harbinensis]MCI1782842.1 MarR family winged helix-turn-helix transcriptional regulator [Schleiferilactobacillus harbinensis]MCI1850783.1 MarR family winged helix-turn-helix transcriptional regulator [Schleiferilactobacillus harbinensis]
MTQTSEVILKTFVDLFQKRSFRGAIASAYRFNGGAEQQPNQMRALQLLADRGELTNSDLVDSLDIRPSSVSVLVQKLESAGLVARHAAPDDKRVQLIGLTDAGRQFVQTTKQLKNDLPSQVFSALNDQEQADLLHLLQKLDAGLADQDDLDWPKCRQFDDMRTWAERFRKAGGWHGFGEGPRGLGR